MEIKHQDTSRINLQAEGPNLRNKVFKHRDNVFVSWTSQRRDYRPCSNKSSQGKYAKEKNRK